MSHFIAALRQVIEADLRRLNELEARLQEARGPEVAGVVRSIGETCDSLSAGLVKLARNTDTIAIAETEPPLPTKDPRGLEIAARLNSLIEHGPCERCGGVSRASD
ncbi:hypothetical protein [Tropicimonas sp. S265A]|uniref:hypothetical protein n=1 Tax=Tropicimonas sp. S265A TaxID=3415134 RepID=UPI003C7C698B